MVGEQIAEFVAEAALKTPVGEQAAATLWDTAFPVLAKFPLAARLFPEARAAAQSGNVLPFLSQADIESVGPLTNPLAAPVSRIKGLVLPKGPFKPNETEWRQIMSSSLLTNKYQALVEKSLAPSLEEAAPQSVRTLWAIRAEAAADDSIKLSHLSGRALPQYKIDLEVPPEELSAGNRLDYGAGGGQEFAKDARLEGLPFNAYSFDPGLDAPLAHDLSRISQMLGIARTVDSGWYLTPEEYRFLGRLRPEPFTFSKFDQLPKGYFDSLFSNWSAIYYDSDVPAALDRMMSLLRPGGRARVNPVMPWKQEAVESWMKTHNLTPLPFRSSKAEMVTWVRPS